MSADDRQKVKAVRVSESVEKGQVFLLAPGGASASLMLGAVGGAASSGAIADAQANLADHLAKHGISIEKIVRDEVLNAIRSSGKLSIASAADAQAPSLKIEVPQYGFGVTHLLSSNVVPVLQVKCEMVDPSGKVIWAASERMLPSIASPMDATAWTQLTSDPKQMEAQLQKAARFLAEKLVQEL